MLEPKSNAPGELQEPQVPMRRLALLLTFLARAEVEAILSQTPIRLANDLTVPQALAASTAARAGAKAYSAKPAVLLGAELNRAVGEVRSRPTFRRHYETQAEFEFVHVPIDSLLAPQWNADLDYVEALAENLLSTEDLAADFDFAFPQNTPPEPIINGNVAIFTSTAPNVTVTPVPTIRQVGEDLEIVARAEGRPNYIMVAELNGRLILENGVHHVLALASKGRKRAAAVLKHVHRREELAINTQSSLFAPDTYFNAARPPLVTDFLTPLATPAVARSVLTVYRVAIQVEQIQVPDPR